MTELDLIYTAVIDEFEAQDALDRIYFGIWNLHYHIYQMEKEKDTVNVDIMSRFAKALKEAKVFGINNEIEAKEYWNATASLKKDLGHSI